MERLAASAASRFSVRRACSAASGRKSRPNLMEVKGSEAQWRHREVGSEGTVERRYDGQELALVYAQTPSSAGSGNGCENQKENCVAPYI
jgi:hypothetical protein